VDGIIDPVGNTGKSFFARAYVSEVPTDDILMKRDNLDRMELTLIKKIENYRMKYYKDPKVIFFDFPLASDPSKIISATALMKDTKLDVLVFDITREQSIDQYDQDPFAIVESIKNGYVVDVMYGCMNEAIFKPPIVIIFSNKPFIMVKKYLSHDRWIVCQSTSEGLIISDKGAIHPGAITPINFKLLRNSSYKTTK